MSVYIPLPTAADLSVSSLLEAVRLADDQSLYTLHVHPSQVTLAQAICLHFAPAFDITVQSDDTLLPTEWYAFAPRVSVAFGSVGP